MFNYFTKTQCVDINECEKGIGCGPGAICTNLAGGKQCECPVGFDGEPYTTGCKDTDECLSKNSCGREALCRNLPGTFHCSCPPGYQGDPLVDCVGKNSPKTKQTCQVNSLI